MKQPTLKTDGKPLTRDELEMTNAFFAYTRPLAKFYMHKREHPFYGNVIGIEYLLTDKGMGYHYSMEYELPGALPEEKKQYASIPIADVEILKTRKTFWQRVKSLFQ